MHAYNKRAYDWQGPRGAPPVARHRLLCRISGARQVGRPGVPRYGSPAADRPRLHGRDSVSLGTFVEVRVGLMKKTCQWARLLMVLCLGCGGDSVPSAPDARPGGGPDGATLAPGARKRTTDGGTAGE